MTGDFWSLHLRKMLPSPRTVIDAGANTGQTVAEFRGWWPAAEIHCIEPVPGAFSRLRAAWGNKPGVHCHRVAIAEQEGSGVIHTGSNTEVSSFLKKNSGYRTDQDVEVDVTTLDAFVERNGLAHVDLLKMDLQGGELLALEGATESLRRGLFDVIFSEIWLVSPYDGAPRYWEIAQHLERFGYLTWWLAIEPYAGTQEGRWGDAMFIGGRLANTLRYGR
jgi:FkbM family methyltransferase